MDRKSYHPWTTMATTEAPPVDLESLMEDLKYRLKATFRVRYPAEETGR